jgi:hypothetical protein
VSVEYTPMMNVRDRTVWLTDHPGATVKVQARRQRSSWWALLRRASSN